MHHVNKTLLHSPETTSPEFYPTAQLSVRGSKFLLSHPPIRFFEIALSNEAKILYAMILRRTELSRKSGWADDYGKIYLYYPINEVCGLLHCGRQKAVDTLRELQYADLVSIKKQGCGKPNRIYPKRYEAVSHTDFKESG